MLMKLTPEEMKILCYDINTLAVKILGFSSFVRFSCVLDMIQRGRKQGYLEINIEY